MTTLAAPGFGLRCAACGTKVSIDTALSWRCPNAQAMDRHHVLHIDAPIAPLRAVEHPNPFASFRSYLAWDAFAAAHGLDDAARVALIEELDAKVAFVAGVGFRTTPYGRADELSDALGFTSSGGVWVKDETHNVAGSHKARHLFGELLHVVTAERTGAAPWREASSRPPLAIASCGNAAFAASTLAKALGWPIRVFVPLTASEALLEIGRASCRERVYSNV